MPQYCIRLAGGQTHRIEATGAEAAMAGVGADPRRVVSVEVLVERFVDRATDRHGERSSMRSDGRPVARAASPAWLRRRGRPVDERLFAQELAVLLEAGIPLLEAVQTLREKDSSGAAAQLDSVLAALQTGQAFSVALEGAGFDRLFVALATASERSGHLPRTLARHAEWLAWSAALRQRLVAAAIYPALLLAASTVVIVFLLLFVLPRFAGVFEGMAADLPVASAWLLALGRAAAAQPALTLGVAALLPLAAVVVWRMPAAARLAGRVAQALPGIGPRLSEIALARLYRVLALLLDAGVPALPALHLVEGLLDESLRPRLQATAAAVERGQRLSDALQGQALATPVALRMVRVGERSGSLPHMLERAAAFHDEALARLSELIQRTVNPLLMLVMGVVIGGIVVLMYLPIFTLVESVG